MDLHYEELANRVEKKPFEKYDSTAAKIAPAFNQSSDIQLTKKKKSRPAEDEAEEEEIPVKKSKKKAKVEEESD